MNRERSNAEWFTSINEVVVAVMSAPVHSRQCRIGIDEPGSWAVRPNNGCLRERVVYTPWGPRVRPVNVCGT